MRPIKTTTGKTRKWPKCPLHRLVGYMFASFLILPISSYLVKADVPFLSAYEGYNATSISHNCTYIDDNDRHRKLWKKLKQRGKKSLLKDNHSQVLAGSILLCLLACESQYIVCEEGKKTVRFSPMSTGWKSIKDFKMFHLRSHIVSSIKVDCNEVFLDV